MLHCTRPHLLPQSCGGGAVVFAVLETGVFWGVARSREPPSRGFSAPTDALMRLQPRSAAIARPGLPRRVVALKCPPFGGACQVSRNLFSANRHFFRTARTMVSPGRFVKRQTNTVGTVVTFKYICQLFTG